MPIHEQTVYPNRNKFTIPNVCKTVNTTKAANAIIIAFASVMVLSFFSKPPIQRPHYLSAG